MSLQPKTRKYRLSFRNKTRIYNNLPFDVRIRKLRNNNYFNADLKIERPHICSAALNQKPLANFTDRVSQISMFKKNNEYCSSSNQQLNAESQTQATTESGSNLIRERALVDFGFLPFIYSCRSLPEVVATQLRERIDSLTFVNGLPPTAVNKAKGLKFKLNIDSNLINQQMDSSALTSLQKSLTRAPHTSLAIDKVQFGACGFYFCSSGTITAKFIETIRLIVARKLKKTGRFWIRVCPDTPVTARSAETRMGRGKGAISHYEAKVRPGQMFMEFSGVPEESVRQIYQQVLKKTAIPITLLY
uniref:Ribosomal protein L16 n=1 Tax=Tupiella akineta TaxID=160070 RepID=Q6UVU0_TUPAK|nr:ribosomal protein L16 [Tupiella akineta]AAQ18734.1 ribosomal protein L16 [Tupiella akineta]